MNSTQLVPNSPPNPSVRVSNLVWLLAALAIVFAVADIRSTVQNGSAHRASTKIVARTQTDDISQLLSTTMSLKAVIAEDQWRKQYFGLVPSGTDPQKSPLNTDKQWKALVKQAELQFDTNLSPGSARRLIIIRGLHLLPMLAATAKGHLPSEAKAPSGAQDNWAKEYQVWVGVSSHKKMTAHEIAEAWNLFQSLPGIGWWKTPAIVLFDRSQPGLPQQGGVENQLTDSSCRDVVLLVAVGFLMIGLGLYGAIVIWYLVSVAVLRKIEETGDSPWMRLWRVEPDRIKDTERKLGPNELLPIFLVYLIMPHIFAFALFGFQIGHHEYTGVASAWLLEQSHAAAGRKAALATTLTAASYLITAGIPIAWLFMLAKRRGASLSVELGLTLGRPLNNFGYAISGYAMVLPTLLIVGLITSRTMHNLAAPSNPAITLLASAPSIVTVITLVVLATIMAPLTEEILFRGVLFQGLRQRIGVWPAILLSGIAFGSVHPVGPAEMVSLSAIGIIFAWVSQSRKSLFPNMLCHLFQNAIATGAMLTLFRY